MADPGALGVFGYSFLDQNRDKVKASSVNGVMPEMDKISSGEYPVSRSLWFYIKLTHASVIPGIMEYVNEFVSEEATEDYLLEAGLVEPAHLLSISPYHSHIR